MPKTKAELLKDKEHLRKRVASLERAMDQRTVASKESEELRVALAEAREQQTATSEILRVISSSPTDVQPVFDAIAHSAVRLLRAYTGALTRVAGDQIELATFMSTDESSDAIFSSLFPVLVRSNTSLHARALRDRGPFNITDTETDARLTEASRANARARGHRSLVVVPMLRHDEPD